MSERSCSNCYACCVFLDIAELNKWGGRACKHLDGRVPDKRCSIYDHRPRACVEYQCAWRVGAFGDNHRPDESGLLVTMYDDPDNKAGLLITINVTDASKAGTLENGPLADMLYWCLNRTEKELTRLTVVNRLARLVVEFANGEIWEGVLCKGAPMESLSFERKEHLGHYSMADSIADVDPALLARNPVVLQRR